MSGSTSDIDSKTGATSEDESTKGVIARDVIAGAAEILGGAKGLAAWVNVDEKNADKFWTTLYPKLIPLQVTDEAGGPVQIAAAIEAARERARGPHSTTDLTANAGSFPVSAAPTALPSPLDGWDPYPVRDDGGAA